MLGVVGSRNSGLKPRNHNSVDMRTVSKCKTWIKQIVLMLMETDKRLGLWLGAGEELVIVRALRYWLGDCLEGESVSLGDLRRSWTVTGMGRRKWDELWSNQ